MARKPRSSDEAREYDLQDRLIDLAVRVSEVCDGLPPSRVGKHIAGQLLRSGTAFAPLHSEAHAAESRKDFVHKLGLCLKELRPIGRSPSCTRASGRLGGMTG